ncbi:DUF4233 domain-containing protein [Pseudomonas sp. IT-P2]|uniref:hypothetical protein n=1 Tax=Pseudomonas sp. IT-P2 TaxID=3026456 RepID=UPI0039E1184A
MNTSLMVVDVILCGLVALAAVEYLRAVDVFKHPVLAAAFYLVAIGAFGVLIETIRAGGSSVYSLILHAGIVVYAWTRRQYIFTAAADATPRKHCGYSPVVSNRQAKAPPRKP